MRIGKRVKSIQEGLQERLLITELKSAQRFILSSACPKPSILWFFRISIVIRVSSLQP